MGLTSLLLTGTGVISRRHRDRGVMFTTHLRLALRLRTSGAMPLLLHVFMVWTGTAVSFKLFFKAGKFEIDERYQICEILNVDFEYMRFLFTSAPSFWNWRTCREVGRIIEIPNPQETRLHTCIISSASRCEQVANWTQILSHCFSIRYILIISYNYT